MSILYCSSQTEPISISNTFHALALEGSWGLFDEIQNLNNLCTSWFNEYSSSIYQALRKKSSSQAYLADGKEISVHNSFNVILTYNPFVANVSSPIPLHYKSMYRVVAMMEPDMEIILRTKCLQCGIKSSNIVASRLKTLHDLCQSSFMSLQSKYQLTLSSFLSIIQTIYGKQRVDTAMDSSRPVSITQPINQSANSNSKYGNTKLERNFLLI
jgi:dynein heavy chain